MSIQEWMSTNISSQTYSILVAKQALVHMGPQVPSPMHSQLLRAWKLELTTSHGSEFLNPKYDMNASMATLFGGEDWDL